MSLAWTPLRLEDALALYVVEHEAEPKAAASVPTLAHFRAALAGLEGWTGRDGDEVIGSVTFSHLVPLTDVTIHAVVAPSYWRRWMSKSILKLVGEKVFGTLALPRMSGYAIVGVNDHLVKPALLHLGFELEGVRRSACRMADGYHDVLMFGVLKEQYRWV